VPDGPARVCQASACQKAERPSSLPNPAAGGAPPGATRLPPGGPPNHRNPATGGCVWPRVCAATELILSGTVPPGSGPLGEPHYQRASGISNLANGGLHHGARHSNKALSLTRHLSAQLLCGRPRTQATGLAANMACLSPAGRVHQRHRKSGGRSDAGPGSASRSLFPPACCLAAL